MLEDEPRNTEIRKLVDVNVNASHAHASILGFIDILRSKESGFVDSGDEIQDLGIQPLTQECQLQMARSDSLDGTESQQTGPSRRQARENSPVAAYLDAIHPPSYMQEPNRDINHTSHPINPDERPNQRQKEPWHQQSQTDPEYERSIQALNPEVTERLTLNPYYPFFDQPMLDLFPNGEMPDLSQLDAELGSLDFFELDGWNAGLTDPGEEL